MRLAAVALVGLAVAGCGLNLARAIEALSHDPATVCLEIETALGTRVRLARTNLPAGIVACSPRAGLRVHIDPLAVVDE